MTEIRQYLFTILLEPSIEALIVDLKNELFEHIGEFSSRHSRPHITIGTMLIDERKEAQLLELLAGVCAHTHPFQIHFSGFGAFKAHTVFVRLDPMQEVRDFMSACEQATLGFPAKKKWKPKAKNPHLTIGRELGKNYAAARALFIDKPFENSSWVNALRVQKRSEKGAYKEHSLIQLEKPR